MISSAYSRAQYGGLGCDLWITIDRPLVIDADGVEHYCTPNHVTTHELNDRFIIANITMPGLRLDVVVALAPHSQIPQPVIRAWWEAFTIALKRHRSPGTPCVSRQHYLGFGWQLQRSGRKRQRTFGSSGFG